MNYGILIRSTGGPDVMEWAPMDVPPPAAGEVRIRHTAVGVNFIDVYDRTGLYPMALPGRLGREGAGIVEAVGSGVRTLKVGDRVAYTSTVPGSYAEARNMPADRVVRLPEAISDEQGAAMMLKGLTAQYLLRGTYRVKRGDPILVHAAAGGVGLILVQWAKRLGAVVIAVVGSDSKAELVRRYGADEVIVTPREDLVTRVREITQGEGVPVVYDSVGHDTFYPSLDCLRPRGLMVTYGNASGPVPAFSPLELSRRGSLFVTRPTLFHYIATRAELQKAASELFKVVAEGSVEIVVGQRFALADAAEAHRALESRRTTGSTVLTLS
jgi:NADPH2:quinone reductase